MVSRFTSIQQLTSGSVIQLRPCKVVFGLSPLDSDKKNRSIKIECTGEEMALFAAYDALQPAKAYQLTKRHYENVFISVKLDPDTQAAFSQLSREDMIELVIKISPWSYDGQRGLTLSVKNMRPVETMNYAFID